ncbi:MAG: hypothetical protein UR15_C0002G0002 [Parcubacteria group bacterium GW2011_GWA2_31_28]|nr:MAG: hypothetical protein UR15_C0002G0002 [Parcubacteria group bacterium GW2011_GWA2_31_28]
MTIQQIYNLAIEQGIKNDFRPKIEIDRILKKKKERFDKLSEKKKKLFDKEDLRNPYSDTRILWDGDSKKQIKKIAVGIDIDSSELLLADKLGDIDLVISHHPIGISLAGLDEVMHLQADILSQYGVPISAVEGLLRPRIDEVNRGLSPVNHNRTVDTARLLNMPLACIHTATDNMVAKYLNSLIQKKKPLFIFDLMEILMNIPEYQEAEKIKAGPRIFSGSLNKHCGKIIIDVTGGTTGASEIYERLSNAGISTVVGMHLAEKNRENAIKAHINIVIAGHMSSDSIGMNLFLDQVLKQSKHKIEIVPLGGFINNRR